MGGWRAGRGVVVAVLAVTTLTLGCTSSTTDRSATTTTSTTIDFEPKTAAMPVTYPAQPDGVAWPTEEWPRGEPVGIDRTVLEEQLDRDFGELSSDRNTTDAVLVVQGGRIVAERYREGFGDESTPHHSWSMAKSFTQALVGFLVTDGKLDIYEPAPVDEWADPEDPRHEITTDELLRMTSGLSWKEDYFAPDSDTIEMLWGDGQDDMAAYAASKPLEAPPDTQISYSTGTSNIVAGIIGGIVGSGKPFRQYVDERLLQPLGIDEDRTQIGWDGAGNLIGGSVFDLTAQDFARFGLLYLRGGEWDGTRLLPEGWVDYARTPTPEIGLPEYGAHWWTYEDCPGGFRAGGFNGQHIVLCPTLDLMVVVLSNRVDGKDGQVRDDLVHLFRDGS